MSTSYIILIVVAGVTLLLLMVLKFKLNAFIALLITSIVVGIMAGMPLQNISASIQEGMPVLWDLYYGRWSWRNFGQMLESSRRAKSCAHFCSKNSAPIKRPGHCA
jgi:Gnt-I system low-affinity gluconate transporter